MEWDDDVIGHLRTLWAEGHPTAEIGRLMGVSKNAVIGKAHRLNLPARPSPLHEVPLAVAARRRCIAILWCDRPRPFEDIARELGTTRINVSRDMEALRRIGAVPRYIPQTVLSEIKSRAGASRPAKLELG